MCFTRESSVIITVDRAGESFQRILIGKLLLKLCLVTKSFVVVLDEV